MALAKSSGGLPLGEEGPTLGQRGQRGQSNNYLSRNATLIIEYLSLAGFAIQKLFSYDSGKIL